MQPKNNHFFIKRNKQLFVVCLAMFLFFILPGITKAVSVNNQCVGGSNLTYCQGEITTDKSSYNPGENVHASWCLTSPNNSNYLPVVSFNNIAGIVSGNCRYADFTAPTQFGLNSIWVHYTWNISGSFMYDIYPTYTVVNNGSSTGGGNGFPVPEISFTATSPISLGSSTNLIWSSFNAVGCELREHTNSTYTHLYDSLSGNVNVTPTNTGIHTYEVTCLNTDDPSYVNGNGTTGFLYKKNYLTNLRLDTFFSIPKVIAGVVNPNGYSYTWNTVSRDVQVVEDLHSVKMGFPNNNYLHSIDIASGSNTKLVIYANGFVSPHCSVYDSDGTLAIFPSPGLVVGDPGFYTPNLTGSHDYKVECYEQSNPSVKYHDPYNGGLDSVHMINSPDLIVSSITPTTVVVPGTYTFNATVTNQNSTGFTSPTTFTNLFQVMKYFDDDGNPVGLRNLAVSGMSALAGNGSGNFSKSITFASDEFFIRACADENATMTGSISELNENNNCSAWRQLVSLPDLTASMVTPISALPGVTTTFSSTITNSGNGATGASFTNLFQTATGIDDNGVAQGVKDYKTNDMPALAGNGATFVAERQIKLSNTERYVRACADKSSATNTGTITESSEANNCSAWRQVVSLPDLIASLPSPTTATLPGTYTFSSIVTNSGNTSTGTSFTNLFQTATGFDDNNVPQGIIDHSVAGMNTLMAGGSDTFSKSINLTALDKFIRACADKSSATNTGTIVESNEANNCSAWEQLTNTTVLPNLTAGAITPTSAFVNVTTDFFATISNIGSVSTGIGFKNLIQVSDGTNIADVLPAISTNALGAGLSTTISKSYKFSKAGVYYVRACADKSSKTDVNGAIVESNENDNCGPWTTVVVEIDSIGVTLSADPLFMVLPTNTAKLTWTTTGSPTSCTASGAWSGSKSFANGTYSETISNLTSGAHAFNITCSRSGVTDATATVTINVAKADEKVNGECATDYWQCLKGNSSANGNNGVNWIWSCIGINGGSTASCSEIMSNQCINGASNYPDCTLCADGTVPNPTCSISGGGGGNGGGGGGGVDLCPNQPGAQTDPKVPCKKIPWWKEL